MLLYIFIDRDMTQLAKLYLVVAGLSPVLWMALGTARSTLSGRIS
jgi:hypothetical protein